MFKRAALPVLLSVLIFFAAGCEQKLPESSLPEELLPDEQTVVSSADFLLDTVIEQKWYGPAGQKTVDDILNYLSEAENTYSVFKENSEISELNRNAGVRPVKLSPEVFAVLARSKEFSENSDKTFDITVAPLTAVWDITNSTEPPENDLITAALSKVDSTKILLDPENLTAMLSEEGMAVDLGGLVKGELAARAGEIADANGVKAGYISIGGNLCVRGKKPDGKDFVFGIRDPRGTASDYIGTVTLDGLTMATSGDYERFYIHDGVRYHHIFDPATGYPSDSGLISVSIISADGMLADYFSTALFVGGPEYAFAHMNSPEFSAVVVTESGEIYISEDLKSRFLMNPNAGGYYLQE